MAAADDSTTFELAYTPTAGDFAEARRWIRVFRLGLRSGITGIAIIASLGVFYLVGSVVEIVQGEAEGWLGAILAALGLLLVTGVVIRAFTVRGRHVVAEVPRKMQVRIDRSGVTIRAGNETEHWSWDEATWLQGLENTWVLSTWYRHLVIPRSAAETVVQFEALVWEHLRKQSPQGGFPVLLENKDRPVP